MDYGNGATCALCDNATRDNHVVSSTPELETKAKALADKLRHLCTQKGHMLGLLMADGEIVVCMSGDTALQQEFLYIVQDTDPSMSPIAHNWSTVPKRTLGGRSLAALVRADAIARPDTLVKVQEKIDDGKGGWRFSATTALVGGKECVCAAPKIISYLTQDAGSHLLPPRNVAMVEVWCGKTNGQHKHGDVRPSCFKCQRLLPTLLCRVRA